ncbi:MAG: gamma-glutamyl-gamma-aminobutyrate hydrolase family protein, partial [Aquificaceae bacterium]|nr:gamma-glutamyl-gamma-aminobutyrate hydrolase family protein [Aquificaceae bacterium]
LMERAIQKEIPLIGICLGCQMLAKVLGAKACMGEKGKEIRLMEVFKVWEYPYFEDFLEFLKKSYNY